MIYREVVKLKFENRMYQMYLGQDNSRFFLEILPDGSYIYPTLENLIKLELIFSNKDKCIMNVVKDGSDVKKFVPKVLVKGVPIALSAALLVSGIALYNHESKPHFTSDVGNYSITQNENKVINENKKVEEDIINDLGFEVKDQDTELDVEKYAVSERFGYKYIYDADYLYLIFGDETITKDDLIDALNNNSYISAKFKIFIGEYINYLTSQFPDADLRIFYHNLKTLKVVECETSIELLKHTLSADSYACYMKSENTIYTLKGYDYIKGTWDYQVIMHEITHAARTYWKDVDNDGDFDIKAQFEGLGVKPESVSEAMNSIFAVRLYDQNEKDIAYQLQSNYFTVILDSVDNYKLSDYINHSMSYLASKLDEAGGYNNYAMTIFELMESQYKDHHDDKIEIAEEEYYPIYDFIADLYFKKNLHSGMSKEEMTGVCDELVQRISFDVPERYHIDFNHFYVYFEEYVQSHGLDSYAR